MFVFLCTVFVSAVSFHRPDLVDWRSLKACDIRKRLESAFSAAEREYGVTRLLDPEGKLILHVTKISGKSEKRFLCWDDFMLDVDTSEPDEKSLITYISSLYDAFPHPPFLHPLYDHVSVYFF